MKKSSMIIGISYLLILLFIFLLGSSKIQNYVSAAEKDSLNMCVREEKKLCEYTHHYSVNIVDNVSRLGQSYFMAASAVQDEEIEHDHKYIKEIVPPQCIEQGYTRYYCLCGKEFRLDYTQSIGHEFGAYKIILEPT